MLRTLLLYIAEDLALDSTLTVWLEPTWHIEGQNGVILGSRQAQVEEEQAHQMMGRLAAELRGRTIENFFIEERTNQLSIRLSGGYLVKTFVSDPTEEESWNIRDHVSKQRLNASPAGFQVISEIVTGDRLRFPSRFP